jgi:hypothetical protein
VSKQQSTVIWLGIVIIALNLVVNASEIKSVIFSGGSKPSGGSSSSGGGFGLPGAGLGGLLPPGLLSTNSAPTPNNIQVV